MRRILLAVSLSLLLLMQVSFSYASSDSGKELFEKKCSKCHSLDRALSKKKDLAAWKNTTHRMAKYSGGAISEAEAEEIAIYLVDCGPESSDPLSDGPEQKKEDAIAD